MLGGNRGRLAAGRRGHDEDREVRVLGDAVRDGAEQQRADARVATRTHHDQRDVVQLGGVIEGKPVNSVGT